MAFANYQGIIAATFVFSAALNIVAISWMNDIEAIGNNGEVRKFKHPFVQADFMFIGECLCLLAFVIIFKKLAAREDGSESKSPLTKGNRKFNPFVLIPPAMMDLLATSLAFVGHSFTTVANFEMLRGSVIVFVALISIFVLKKKPSIRQWIGITLIVVALIIVGFSGHEHEGDETIEAPDGAGKPDEIPEAEKPDNIGGGNNGTPEERKGKKTGKKKSLTSENDDVLSIVGCLLIVIAQLITACQVVYEEAYVNKLDIAPLQMVGYEGIFGLIALSLLLIPLSFIPNSASLQNVNSSGSLEDTIDAMVKIGNNTRLLVPITILIVSTSLYNYAGLSITKEMSGTARMVFDSLKIFLVWMIALIYEWQRFHYRQPIGFLVLVVGICVYNNFFLIKKITSKFSKK